MSRNMINANTKVFRVLEEFINQSNVASPYPPDAIRYIKTDKSEEKVWLQELKIIKTYDLANVQFATIRFKNEEYFAVVGWIKSVNIENVLEEKDINSGIYTALISELKIKIRKDAKPYEILDKVLFLYKEENNSYTGHDFNILSDFFEPILFYKIDDNSPHRAENLFNIAGYFMAKNSMDLFLNYSDQTILEFEKLFMEGTSDLPYENLINSLTSIQWKYSFLDCYRCLERLFPLLKLGELHQKLQSDLSLIEFASEIENTINWKPKEDISIREIIEDSPKESIHLLKDIKKCIDGDSEGKLGDSFYKIRNSIVHFRPATKTIEIDSGNWDKLIRATLKIIRHWYNIFESKM